MNSKNIGDLTEMMVLVALTVEEFRVSIPWGENTSYDLVAEKDNIFYRVQCKTGKYDKGVITFGVRSIFRKEGKVVTTNYIGKVEYFGVFCPQLNKTYLVPCENHTGSISLRVDKEKGKGSSEIRYAKDFEIGRLTER